MQLAAVLLARVLLFVESFDLNPRGVAHYPDIVQGLVEKCGFLKFPRALEDFDEDKGVEFLSGKWGNVTIEAAKIYRNGILLDTRVSTAESQRILKEMLTWAVSTFGLMYEPKMISRSRYLSNLTFYSESPILSGTNSPVSRLAHRVSAVFAETSGIQKPWDATALSFHVEHTDGKPFFAPFTIQRRAEAAFSENKYFSEAPFPTDIHISLIEQLETDVIASTRG